MSMLMRLAVPVLFVSLAACSGGASNSRLDYKEADSLRDLEVPPDLVMPVNTGSTDLPSVDGGDATGEVLPRVSGVEVVHESGERWLRVNTPVEELWPRLRSFWNTLGLELRLDKPGLGVMETGWAENRADAPSGFITDWIKKVFSDAYSAGTRDKYRLRLERAEGNGSEIFISHYGLKEIATEEGQGVDVSNVRWETRPSDPELVAEVMLRLVRYLGGSERAAAKLKAQQSTPERSRIDGDVLIISEGFARSWRLTGIALDRIGLVVADRNRSQGLYYLGQIDLRTDEEKKEGWFSSLFSSSDEDDAEGDVKVMVRLVGDENQTRLSALNTDGTPRRDKLASELLVRLQKELK